MKNLIVPRCREIEAAVIGELISEPTLIKEGGLTAGDFYGDSFRRIFTAMQNLSRNGGGVDLLLLVNHLSQEDFEILNQVSGKAFTTANFSSHASRLKELSAKRRLQADCLEAARSFHNGEAEEILQRLYQSLSEVMTGTAPEEERELTTLKQAIIEADQIRGMDFPEKRKILSPWLSEQSLVLVSGWRGAGKTWFAPGVCEAITRGISPT